MNTPRRLGSTGPAVFPLALGCMGMSGMYGPSDAKTATATIHAALESGVTLFDTGDFYGMGHNEILLGRALEGRRDRALISVKVGAMRGPDGSWLGFDARPVAVKNSLPYSLKRLGVDHIDIYRPARRDSGVPIEDTIGAIADLVRAGYVRAIGLSEVSPETRIFPVLAELGICVTAYGVLSRGLLAGSTPSRPGDFRAHFPRFTPDNLARNRQLVATLADLAAEKGVSAAQLAVAWVLAKGESIVPVVGARTPAQLAESLGSLSISLSPSDLTRIQAAIPASAVAGDRYAAPQMQMLD